MPSTGLSVGPYGLSTQNINSALTRTSPGAYALGHLNAAGEFVVKYVGRDDVDVARRLADHARTPKYSCFKANYVSSPKAGFEWECQMYHDFPGLDNVIHPARPTGATWRCPRCQQLG